ncbi:hypothetical protein [Motilimonas pumila]|uniref:DUF4178 domain-containing protein n=1 Tax=Motilimonas pumila TaxID=2303987 RepID=A0A418YAV8_9GAMM|nr:hypothetical protein [Motilimonas pumila]RJG40096.1 hypothetical protein D1Z90_17235 [Motilimonas pumila]
MSFLKKLFGKPAEKIGRELSHPQALQVGDLLQMSDSFALPEAFRKQQFELLEVQTQEFEFRQQSRLICRGASQQDVFLLLDEKDRDHVGLSVLLRRADVEALFDMDAFAEIFDEPGSANLTPLTQDSPFGPMIANNYVQQDFATQGYFHDQDYRGQKPPAFTDQAHGRQFEYFALFGEQEMRWLEIYVFENGDTDVYLTLKRPVTDIAELWPKS